jgi:hypothetical protein
MLKYGKWLNRQSRRLRDSKLTIRRVNDGQLGWRFGDCHVDTKGELHAPHYHHDHFENNAWKWDANSDHMIVASDNSLVWSEPLFGAGRILKQSRYGMNISKSNLAELLVRVDR